MSEGAPADPPHLNRRLRDAGVRFLSALALILTLAACRADEPAGPARPGPRQTTGVRAAQLQADLEAQMLSWDPRDGAVEFVLLRSDMLPKYRLGDEDPAADGHLVLEPGEKLVLHDHHFSQEFTLRSASENQVEFDYRHQHRPPSGNEEIDTGRIALTRGLLEGGFQERWRSCSTTPQCAIIPTYCGGYAAVSKGGSQLLAGSFYRKMGSLKQCSGKTMAPPVASCIEGKCEPAPVFPAN